jgi:dipeptidyl aminopeptidase/acylaminoacyl peptidase
MSDVAQYYTPEMAVGLQIPGDARLAPGGRQVAFSVAPIGHPTPQRTSAIYIASTEGTATPRDVTGNAHNNTNPRWSNDGLTLAFLSDRVVPGEFQLYRVSAVGGEPERLTSLAGGVADPNWSAGDRSIYFTARRRALDRAPDESGGVRVWSQRWRPRALAAVPSSGGAAWLVGPAEGHVWSYAPSPDGDHIAAFVTPTEELASTWDSARLIVFRERGDETELARTAGAPGRIAWSPDGRYVTFVGVCLPQPEDQRVFVVEVGTRNVTKLDNLGMFPVWSAFSGDDLYVLSVEGQRRRLDRTDPHGSGWERCALDPEVDDGWPGSANCIDLRQHGIVFDCSSARRAPDLYFAPIGGPARRLTDLNPQLAGVTFASMEPLSWQARDGCSIEGWLVRPPFVPDGTHLPLVADIHGGPAWHWGNWFHGTWHYYAQVLAARGFAVLLPNPRGSTGWGVEFTDANRSDLGGGDFSDIMSGIDMLIERGIADPQRLGIGGWSYGGCLTAWAITQTDRFKAAAAGAAPTNWVSKLGTTDIRPFDEWSLGELLRDPDGVWRQSAIRYLNRVSTPTLILHGEEDSRVPVSQSVELYLGLLAAGVETELVTYPRQEHLLHERDHQLDLLRRVIAWFERFLVPPM